MTHQENDEDSGSWMEVFDAAARRFHRQSARIAFSGSIPGGVVAETDGVGGKSRRDQGRTDRATINRLGRDVASRLWSRVQIRPQPGPAAAPLDALVSALGIRVTYTDQLFDGHLPGHSDTEIRLRRDAAPSRSRFTTAHELGHFWLRSRRPRHPADSVPDSDVERLCDAIAAHLLVNDAALRYLGPRPEIGCINYVAESLRVSTAVVVNRAVESNRWRCLVVHWERSNQGWTPARYSGGPWDPRSWVIENGALTSPVRRRYLTLPLSSVNGTRNVTMQIGSSSRNRITALVVRVTATAT